ncbi:MAG TPA: PfkB family carbohydrate kinase [Solirubrobacteraceae bacterium]|nr:PfkB family carbohydrate kinase [Solirubrobacteraceae bacterium]
MSRVVVLGDVMVDVVARLSGPLAHGSDSPAVVRFHGGGSAANTAAWLAAAGGRPVLAARVGDDERGRGARDELRALGVDARLGVDPELPTGTCIVLVGPDGERTMAPDAGANDALAPEDLPNDVLAADGHLHLVGYALLRPGSRPAALEAMARARARGMTVSVDPSSSALLSDAFLDDCEDAQLLLPNASEAHALTGESAPERAARALAGRVGEVVVKLGPEGALWTNGEEVLRAAAVPFKSAIDSTGAGDAFAAGLLHARASGASTAESLAAACKLAAEAVATPGARP